MYFTQHLILCPGKAKIIMRNKRVSVVTARNIIELLQYRIFAWTRILNPNSSTVYFWQIELKWQKKMLTSYEMIYKFNEPIEKSTNQMLQTKIVRLIPKIHGIIILRWY